MEIRLIGKWQDKFLDLLIGEQNILESHSDAPSQQNLCINNRYNSESQVLYCTKFVLSSIKLVCTYNRR